MTKSFIFLIGLCSLIYVSSAGLVGGWSDVENVNSPEIQKYARMATKNITDSMHSPFHLKMMNITKAEKQVVSGMNYKMEVQIGPTECKRNGNYTDQEIEDCPLQKCDNPLVCTFVVWVQPWRTNPVQKTKSTCALGDTFC
ncbi:cystatin-1 [Trichonephila clavipes]|nr:cystatin-1 [Trichonephila clavipes]